MGDQELKTSKYDRYKATGFRSYNGRMPEEYDKMWWMHVFPVARWDDAIIAELKPGLATMRVLDVGCATGRLLDNLARNGATHVYGVDIAPRILEKAGEKLSRLGVHHELKTADVEEGIPWPDSFFDAAVLSGAIHHFLRPQDALAAISKVLKPGGRLYVVEPRFWPGIRHVLNLYLRFFQHDGDYHFRSPKQMVELLSSSGFEPVAKPSYPVRFSYMVVASNRDR